MKPLNLKETALKEEMKERCLTKGQYIDENAKAKFEMLCHLEDFEVQYWKLQKENEILKENAENNDKAVDKVNWENMLLKKENKQLKMINKEYERLNKVNNRGFKITNVKEYDIYDLLRYKENWNKLKEYLHNVDVVVDYSENYDGHFINYDELIDKMQELEKGSENK